MKVNVELIYPAVRRELLANSDAEKHIPITLNIGCRDWINNTAMRHGFCELIFAGAGNHPGMWDGDPDHEFDAGDQGINNVHRQWAVARTRSMSVGDVVCIDPKGFCEFWICDSEGFTLLTPDQAASWLQYPRKYGCDMFELNRWKETAEPAIRG